MPDLDRRASNRLALAEANLKRALAYLSVGLDVHAASAALRAAALLRAAPLPTEEEPTF